MTSDEWAVLRRAALDIAPCSLPTESAVPVPHPRVRRKPTRPTIKLGRRDRDVLLAAAAPGRPHRPLDLVRERGSIRESIHQAVVRNAVRGLVEYVREPVRARHMRGRSKVSRRYECAVRLTALGAKLVGAVRSQLRTNGRIRWRLHPGVFEDDQV